MQKSFFSSSDKFLDKTLIGIDDVFEETIAPDFLVLNIFFRDNGSGFVIF